MEWLTHLWELITHLINPQTIINYGGLWLLVLVIFAETGLLAGFFLPGDSLLFTAGLLAADPKLSHHGWFDFNIYNVLIYVTLAAILGDSVGYAFGRRGGAKVFNKPKSIFFKPEYVSTTRNFYYKHGDKALILGRFLPIIRTFAPVMAGVVALHYPRFLSYNVIGGILWVFSLSLLGYYCGSQFPWIKDYYEYIVLAFIVVTTVPVVITIIKETKANKAEKAKLEDLKLRAIKEEAEEQSTQPEDHQQNKPLNSLNNKVSTGA